MIFCSPFTGHTHVGRISASLGALEEGLTLVLLGLGGLLRHVPWIGLLGNVLFLRYQVRDTVISYMVCHISCQSTKNSAELREMLGK